MYQSLLDHHPVKPIRVHAFNRVFDVAVLSPGCSTGYFLKGTKTITAPTAITAIPISGDQFRLCLLLAVTLSSPRSSTFSLEKYVTVVNMVKSAPMIIITIPAFFIGLVLIDLYLKNSFSKK